MLKDKVFLFGRYWRLDVVLFVMCPAIITMGQVLDWFLMPGMGLLEWIVGATDG